MKHNGMDIKRQINIHEMLRDMYITEKEYTLKKLLIGPSGFKSIDYSGAPHGSGGAISVDRSMESLTKIQSLIDLEQCAINSLTAQSILIRTKIRELSGLDAQVVNLRDINGMTLQGIADRLGYSLIRIKQISCRNPR